MCLSIFLCDICDIVLKEKQNPTFGTAFQSGANSVWFLLDVFCMNSLYHISGLSLGFIKSMKVILCDVGRRTTQLFHASFAKSFFHHLQEGIVSKGWNNVSNSKVLSLHFTGNLKPAYFSAGSSWLFKLKLPFTLNLR